MKKLISAVLAVVMLAMCGFSVFAVNITKKSDTQKGDVVVYTNAELEDVMYYITIPADTAIQWNETGATNMDYTVTSQLDLGGSVSVSVSAAAENGKYYLKSSSGNKLEYTFGGFAVQTFNEFNDNAHPQTPVTVTVSDWTGVPIAEYRATLTYTVKYAKGSIS